MTEYSQQLRDGADEVLNYFLQHPSRMAVERRCYHRLAYEMRTAADLESKKAAGKAILGIADWLIDQFPIADNIFPSFNAALNAVKKLKGGA